MDPDDRVLLKETLKLAQENNRLLRKINSSMRWARIMRTLYWVVIIGTMLGAYYLLQPVIESARGTYQNLQTSFDKVQGTLESLPSNLPGLQQ